MKNRGHAEIVLVKALLVAVACGTVAHAGLGYLPQVGPPALRVQIPVDTASSVASLELADTNLASVLALSEAQKNGGTNNAAFAGQTNATPELQSITAGGDIGPLDAFGNSILSLGSPDPLNITPQMLATYFHPEPRGTNAAGEVLVPVIFTPPQVHPRPSSHAEYIVK